MQPVRLKIYGDFWDSQLYSGRLYLWDMNNALYVYDWDAIVKSLFQDSLELPFVCAFSQGGLLYYPSKLSIVFEDPDVHKILKEKFDLISQQDLSLSLNDIGKFLMSKQDSPFDALHDDCTIYYDSIYALMDSGLHMAKAIKPVRNKYKVDRKSKKLWDGTGTSIQPKYRVLAIASAGEGLFEYVLQNGHEPRSISKRHTLFVNWSFANIYGSSDISPGYMAEFYCYREEERNHERYLPSDFSISQSIKYIRKLQEIIEEKDIFKSSYQNIKENGNLSWGGNDKLYLVNSGWVDVVRFTKKYVSVSNETYIPFQEIGKIDLKRLGSGANDHAIAGGVAYFGLIIEYKDHLLVIMSNDEPYIIQGPVTRWRTFPRSKQYVNQLHVILDDRIEIYSFNNDYFVDQHQKVAGMEYRETKSKK